jgi:hypothetical protein
MSNAESVFDNLKEYLSSRGIELVITSADDIPQAESAGRACALCGRSDGKTIKLPKARKGNNSTRTLYVCADLVECANVIEAEKAERDSRVEKLAAVVKVPTGYPTL